ncbi:peptidylprolyl isomerase [bacterium]|nr:peptidylprolyl isomerase [bacterium]
MKSRFKLRKILKTLTILSFLAAGIAACGGRREVGVIETDRGTIVVELYEKDAPQHVANFKKLASQGFYNGLTFHRIVPGFVIQGGDPTGTGTSGPGYTTVDPPPADARYTKGVVAMAKTAAEPPGTAGSQFFVVTAADAGLPPEYAMLGKVTAGLDVVEEIGAFGDSATEQPTEAVRIEQATVRET